MLAFGLLLLFVKLSIGLGLIALGLVISSTHYRLYIDLDKKVYRDAVWFLGMKFGQPVTYERIEYIFIKTSKESQRMNVRVATTIIHKTVFDGYFKFADDKKLHILSRDSREQIMRKLQPIADAMSIPVMDYTRVRT